MDPQDLQNHLLEIAAHNIAQAATSAHLIERADGTTELHVYRDNERLGAFDQDTYLCELLRNQLDLEERPFRFVYQGDTYIGWSAIAQVVIAENNRKGLLPLEDMRIEATDPDGKSKTLTGMEVLYLLQQTGALRHGPIQGGGAIRLT